MDHGDDKAHLTDEIKQKNILIAGAAPALLCTTAGRTFLIFMEKRLRSLKGVVVFGEWCFDLI